MKTGFFGKTALGNIGKNYRFFLPRIVAQAGLLGIFYIVFTLKNDKRIGELHGGNYIGMFMSIGVGVLVILSAVLVFYINAFLMKQRQRELGLYTVLGMEKRHVVRVLFFETAFCSLATLVIGLGFGVLFYKLFSLLICRLLHTEIVLGFYFLRWDSLCFPALFFLALDGIAFLFNCIRIVKMKPVDLLNSRFAGEREPKVKWVLLLAGVLCLGGGYAISLTTENPLSAIMLFFVAVVLVIFGTYFLFVAGSIFVLKALKKNKKYYYHKNHMPAISGLLYRMKQNAVGLASISLLATGVLVMISTTVSLYAGMSTTLTENYPQHFYVNNSYYSSAVNSNSPESVQTVAPEIMTQIVQKAADRHQVKIKELATQEFFDVTCILENGTARLEQNDWNVSASLAGLSTLTFVTEDVYKSIGGKPLHLQEDEIAICPISASDNYNEQTFTIAGTTYKVKTVLMHFPIRATMISASQCYGVVLPSQTAMDTVFASQKEVFGENASEYQHRIAVIYEDLDAACAVGEEMDKEITDAFIGMMKNEESVISWGGTDSLWEARESLYGMYGSLLFLGILLGTVCLFATALITYYKQISEGYEDRQRFQIMQKIGMSNKEVKKTIGNQILWVFFLPLAVAGVHFVFAFPILNKLLLILMLPTTKIFILCSLAVYILFALIYVLIYVLTARAYYTIVR